MINPGSAYGGTAVCVFAAVVIIVPSMKRIFGVNAVTCWRFALWRCAVATDPAQQQNVCPLFALDPSSISIFMARYIQSIQMSFDCVSGNSTSGWRNEIKGAAGVMDRLVSWFGGNTEKRGDSASGCHNPFSSSDCASPSLSPSFSPNLILCVSLHISPLNSHLSVLGTGTVGHVLGRREPSLGEQWAKAIHGRFITV